MPNATMIAHPPTNAAALNGVPVSNQSTIATRKIVRSAATELRTGLVRLMRTRKEPEKTALDKVEMKRREAASPRGSSKGSMPVKWRMGMGIQSTQKVKQPIMLPKVLAKIMPRPGLQPSGGQAKRL